MGGAKGVLAISLDLPPSTINLRPSMIKFESGYDILELLDLNKFRGGYLNRQIMLLLLTLKVPEKVFEDLQKEYLEALDKAQLKDASIFLYFNADYNGELQHLPPITVLLRKLINAGFELLTDPFFQGIQRTLRQRGLTILK